MSRREVIHATQFEKPWRRAIPPTVANGILPLEPRGPRRRTDRGKAVDPVNPPARSRAPKLKNFHTGISDEQMLALCENLYKRAVSGDMAAAKLILRCMLGKPLPAPDLDVLDRNEWITSRRTR